MGHRWDIQLLRAIAVLSVLAYHSGVPHFQGGSLGVDVFFVISGYLITITWLRQSAAGPVDSKAFLRHRLARTLPAAAVTAAAVTVVVAMIARDRWADMAWHLVASLTATENVLVSGLTWGDWEPSVEALTPFTHFWSMSMEVQFYLVWPLALAAVAAVGALRAAPGLRRTVLLLLLGVVAVVSAHAYVTWGVSSHGVAYFSPMTRAWQLAAGAGLGLILPSLRPAGKLRGYVPVLATVGAVIGVATLVWCFMFGGFARDTDSAFWGFAVVAATAALLALGRGLPPLSSRLRRLLLPLLAVGTISYGVYLWHLPVLWTVSELGWAKTPLWWVFVVGMSIGAATLSWHWVEKPAIAWSRRRGTEASAPTVEKSAQRELQHV